jgi:preprotein translocase subunit SecG
MSILSIFLGVGTFALIATSLFLVLVVLAQKAKSDGGMGAAMGGGMAEATFGAETGNVLTKLTIVSAVLFFVLSFSLYMGRIYERKHAAQAAGASLPSFAVPPASKPVPAPAPAAAKPAPAGVAVPASTAPAPAPTGKP